MKCSDLARWLRDNPGVEMPEGLKGHAAGCPGCRKLLDEQAGLERALRSLPSVEPPDYFETRLKAAVLGGEERTKPSWRPLLVPAAALLLLAAATAFLANRHTRLAGPVSVRPPETVVPATTPVEGVPPSPAPLAPSASGLTAIYPVWPGDGDVVSGDDVSIMASLYPAPPPGAVVSMTLNDRDVSGRVRADGELVSFDPGRMEPGRHVVTITLRESGGGIRSVTYSFFALEARS